MGTALSGDGASQSQMLEAKAKYGLQGMPQLPGTIFNRAERALFPAWSSETDKFVTELQPGIKNGTYAGVFMGDEICCSGTPLANLTAVANKLRAGLGSTAVIYTNECSEIHEWDTVPDALDYISIDFYDEHNTNGTGECDKDRQFYEQIIYPKMKPHQGVLLVPGVFASDPVHCQAGNVSCPLDQQAVQVVAKLEAMFAWAKEDARVAGFNPWHYNNRSGAQLPGWWDQRLGAIAMPSVVKKLREIGQYIKGLRA